MRHGGKGNVGLRPFQAARPSTAEAAVCPSRFCQEARNVRSGQRNGLPYDGLRSDFAMGRALENWRLRVDSNHSAPPWLERPGRVGLCRSPFSPRMTWLGRVGMWRDGVRSGISVAAPFARAVPYRPDHSSVSTPLSSNVLVRSVTSIAAQISGDAGNRTIRPSANEGFDQRQAVVIARRGAEIICGNTSLSPRMYRGP